MANYNDLKTGINAVIKTNGRQEISGAALNTALNNMITELGAGYQYMGIATPATNPGTPDANVFYLASEAGTYTNFGGIVINEGEVCALAWNGTWTKQVTGAATADQLNQLGQQVIYDVTKNNSTAGPNNDGKFESLSALLSDANLSTLIPIAIRCGGMSIRFVQTSDNKYVQFRLMKNTWSTTVSDWQGVDNEPVMNSRNLVESGGVYEELNGKEINMLKWANTQIIQGERMANAGFVMNDPSFWRTNAIPVNSGMEITSVCQNIAIQYHFFFYNSAEIGSASFVQQIQGRKANVPEGATYMALYMGIENAASGCIVCDTDDVETEYPTYGMDTLIGGIYTKDETDVILDSLKNELEDEIDEIQETILDGREINLLKLPTTEIIDGSRISNNGDILSDANYWRTNAIPVKSGELLTSVASNVNIGFSFCFYRSSTISSVDFVSKVPGRKAEVPAGASYLVVFNSNDVKSGAIVCNADDIETEYPTYGMDTLIGGIYTKEETDELLDKKQDIQANWCLDVFGLDIISIQTKRQVLAITEDDTLYGSNGYRLIFKATEVDLSDVIPVFELPSMSRLNNLLFIGNNKAVGYVVSGVADDPNQGFWLFENCDTETWTGRKTGAMDYGFPGNNFQSLIMADNGYIFASEYSIKSAEHPSNKIYRSTDGGETWSACYTHLTADNTHMHAIEFDKYRQRVWGLIGDYGNGGRPGWIYSDDYGDTWAFVEAEEGQRTFMDTMIIPTRKYVLVGSDAHPAGIRKWQPEEDIKHATVLAKDVSCFYDVPVEASQNFGFARKPVVDIKSYPYRIAVSFSYDQTYSHACLLFSPDFMEWHMMDYVTDPRTNLFFSVLSGITSDGWVIGYDESHQYYRYFKYPNWIKN